MNIKAIIITTKSGLIFVKISFLSPSRRNLERQTFLEDIDEGFVAIKLNAPCGYANLKRVIANLKGVIGAFIVTLTAMIVRFLFLIGSLAA